MYLVRLITVIREARVRNLIIVLARTMFIFKISLEHDLIGYLHDHREPKLEAGEKI